MKDLILRLMEIEEKARLITSEEDERLENLDAELKAAEEKKRVELKSRAQNRIEKMRSEAHDEAEKKIEELNLANARETQIVKELFAKNRSRWSKQIYEEIIAL